MISMPLFPEESWYFCQVRKYAVDGRFGETKRKMELEKIDNLLAEVISKKDFPSRSVTASLLECIVLATYEELERIYKRLLPIAITTFCEMVPDGKGNLKRVLKEKWLPIYKIYDKLVDNGINTKMIHKYGIKCCPYCNENYIFNRKVENGTTYAMAQLDHFFPRDRFPIFAVSLYNLVPACSACNHIKTTKEIGISPHNHSYDLSKMYISYIPKSGSWMSDPEELEVQFKYSTDNAEFKNKMDDNLDVMGIRRAYDMHKDYVQEILKKAQIYGKGHRENLMRDFSELFSSDEELIQAIFSNYICEEDMLKRPLSKITMDLLKELSII